MLDRSSPSAVHDIMQRYGLFPKKRWGQNFLIDRNIMVKIAESCHLTPDSYVVEIGPGLGGLTQELAKGSRGVLAIEIDRSLQPALNELAAEYHNIKCLYDDVLKVDIERALEQAFGPVEPESYQVCANIPYNITTPIIFHLLHSCPRMHSATLMMQQEVGARLLAAPGSKDYGRLTVAAAYYAQVRPVINVSRNCFYPRPEVDSVVVRITPHRPKPMLVNQESIFTEFLKAAFQSRRKTLLNITAGFFQLTKADTELWLNELSLKSNLRPENLSLEDFVRLINRFAP